MQPSAVNKSNANLVREKLFGKQMRRRQVNFKVGEKVRHRFYKEELQLVDLPKVFIVEEVLKKKKRKGKNVYLIRWRGYPPQFDEWVDEAQLEAI
eukprot:gene16423-biopygen12103